MAKRKNKKDFLYEYEYEQDEVVCEWCNKSTPRNASRSFLFVGDDWHPTLCGDCSDIYCD